MHGFHRININEIDRSCEFTGGCIQVARYLYVVMKHHCVVIWIITFTFDFAISEKDFIRNDTNQSRFIAKCRAAYHLPSEKGRKLFIASIEYKCFLKIDRYIVRIQGWQLASNNSFGFCCSVPQHLICARNFGLAFRLSHSDLCLCLCVYSALEFMTYPLAPKVIYSFKNSIFPIYLTAQQGATWTWTL